MPTTSERKLQIVPAYSENEHILCAICDTRIRRVFTHFKLNIDTFDGLVFAENRVKILIGKQ